MDCEEQQEPAAKRKRTECQTAKRREALEVCDIILREAKDRFSFTGHLVAASLFHSEKFSDYVYVKNFPEECLNVAVQT